MAQIKPQSACWKCTLCTYAENGINQLQCEMCDTPNPSYQYKDELNIDDNKNNSNDNSNNDINHNNNNNHNNYPANNLTDHCNNYTFNDDDDDDDDYPINNNDTNANNHNNNNNNNNNNNSNYNDNGYNNHNSNSNHYNINNNYNHNDDNNNFNNIYSNNVSSQLNDDKDNYNNVSNQFNRNNNSYDNYNNDNNSMNHDNLNNVDHDFKQNTSINNNKSMNKSNQNGNANGNKWNCLICTMENDPQNAHCSMCHGPSPIKNELFGTKICRQCNTVNKNIQNKCKNCKIELTDVVTYDDNFKLILEKIEKKKPKKKKKKKKYPIYNHKNHYHNNNNSNNYTNPFHFQAHNNNNNNNNNNNSNMYVQDDFDDDQYDSFDDMNNYNQWNANDWGSSPLVFHNNHSNNNKNNNNNNLQSIFSNMLGGLGMWGPSKNQNNKKQKKENDIPRVNVKQEYETAMKTGQIKRCRLIQRRGFVENDDGDAHFRLCESQFVRSSQRNMQYSMMMNSMKYNANNNNNVSNMEGLNKTIREVEYIINPSLIKKFENKKQELINLHKFASENELNIVLAWHGTPNKNLNGIVTNNFSLTKLSSNSGDTGWYGKGIYFSEYASISRGYGDGLLLSKVILGKSYRMNTKYKNTGRGLQKGYDSHLVVGNNNNQYGQEIVIFDVDQILPCYIVKY